MMDMAVDSKTKQPPTPSAAHNDARRQMTIHAGAQMQLGHRGTGSGMSPRKIVLNEHGPRMVPAGPVSCGPVHGREAMLPSLTVEDMGVGRLEGCRAGNGPESDACVEVGTPLTPTRDKRNLDSALQHHEQKLPEKGADLDHLRVTPGGTGPQVMQFEMNRAKHVPVGGTQARGPGQGQCDTMRVEERTYPCPTRDGQPYVQTTVRDGALHYLGLSADTARPPGLPKSPPPCKGRRQR